ncbi:hypothetical protein TNCV_3653831 [Trichonephila clavipes]|nr:hypothetical protein TNCV_3653831 [Trichonephila clavipes]
MGIPPISDTRLELMTRQPRSDILPTRILWSQEWTGSNGRRQVRANDSNSSSKRNADQCPMNELFENVCPVQFLLGEESFIFVPIVYET